MSGTDTKSALAAKISAKFAAQFAPEEEIVLNLTDEMSQERIDELVAQSRQRLPEAGVAAGDWEGLKAFLTTEMKGFSEMRTDYRASQKKCLMAEQRLNEALHPEEGEVIESLVMACLWVIQESKVKRDNLRARIEMMINELTTLILAGRRDQNDPAIELRLRSVFAGL